MTVLRSSERTDRIVFPYDSPEAGPPTRQDDRDWVSLWAASGSAEESQGGFPLEMVYELLAQLLSWPLAAANIP